MDKMRLQRRMEQIAGIIKLIINHRTWCKRLFLKCRDLRNMLWLKKRTHQHIFRPGYPSSDIVSYLRPLEISRDRTGTYLEKSASTQLIIALALCIADQLIYEYIPRSRAADKCICLSAAGCEQVGPGKDIEIVSNQ